MSSLILIEIHFQQEKTGKETGQPLPESLIKIGRAETVPKLLYQVFLYAGQ
jgi:hypothetical protein